MDWNMKDLERWGEIVEQVAREQGLDFFPIEYEIYSHKDMLSAMAYTGIPIHYGHWSYGKAYELQETFYYYGLTGLPYEMVINSNPSIAYLMRDNSLLAQIMVMAHVCAHVDFFKNNTTFAHTRPELALEMFKNNARRIRSYCEDPSIGEDKVEKWLDAAHSIALNTGDPRIKDLNYEEKINRMREKYFKDLERWKSGGEIGTKPIASYRFETMPPEPEKNLLLFIRDFRPDLKEWQKDILTIVDREARYFMPQIETKISNEGWASFWHYTIMKILEEQHNLPQGMYIEFLSMHSKVCRPSRGRINPYHLGIYIWRDVEKRLGRDELFLGREYVRDISYLRQYLTKEIVYKLDLFQYGKRDDGSIVVDEVADEDNWKKVKETLIRSTGRNSLPLVQVLDGNYRKDGSLLLQYEDPYDRDLEPKYKEKTLEYIKFLWNKDVFWKSKQDGPEKV